MTKWLYCSVAALLMAACASAALELTELPNGYVSDWAGKSAFAVNLGGGQYVYGRVEFAVYDAASAADAGLAVPGDRQYLYAYQVFNTDGNAAMTYFALTGLNPAAIDSADQIGTAPNPGSGIDAEAYFDTNRTKAIFTFEDGMMVVGQSSVFLLLGSDAKPIVGGYEVVPSSQDNIWIPGEDTNQTPVPDPATMLLLLTGTAMSLRKRK